MTGDGRDVGQRCHLQAHPAEARPLWMNVSSRHSAGDKTSCNRLLCPRRSIHPSWRLVFSACAQLSVACPAVLLAPSDLPQAFYRILLTRFDFDVASVTKSALTIDAIATVLQLEWRGRCSDCVTWTQTTSILLFSLGVWVFPKGCDYESNQHRVDCHDCQDGAGDSSSPTGDRAGAG